VVRHHAGDHHDRRQDETWRIQQSAANGGGEQARPFGHRGAVDDGDDDPQRREIGQGARHADEQPLQVGGRQKALRLQHLAGHRIDCGPAQTCADQAQNNQAQDQPKE